MTPAEKLAEAKKRLPRKPSDKPLLWRNTLRERCDKLGLTERDVAEVIGLSPAGYHHIKSGTVDPSLSHVMALCKFFGCTVEELFVEYLGEKK